MDLQIRMHLFFMHHDNAPHLRTSRLAC